MRQKKKSSGHHDNAYLKPLYSLPPLSLAVSSYLSRRLWCDGGNDPGPEGEELFGAGDEVRWGGVALPNTESVSVMYLELYVKLSWSQLEPVKRNALKNRCKTNIFKWFGVIGASQK